MTMIKAMACRRVVLGAVVLFVLIAQAHAEDKVGVEPCDGYLAKYRACVDAKATETDKPQQLGIIEKTRRRWVYLAGNPATKNALPSVCDSAWESMKIQLSIMGCE